MPSDGSSDAANRSRSEASKVCALLLCAPTLGPRLRLRLTRGRQTSPGGTRPEAPRPLHVCALCWLRFGGCWGQGLAALEVRAGLEPGEREDDRAEEVPDPRPQFNTQVRPQGQLAVKGPGTAARERSGRRTRAGFKNSKASTCMAPKRPTTSARQKRGSELSTLRGPGHHGEVDPIPGIAKIGAGMRNKAAGHDLQQS